LEQQAKNQEIYFFDQMKSGNENAFDFFFNFYYSGLCIYAKKFLHNFHLAEEIVQSVYFKFWNDRKSIQITESVRAYLFSAVRNKCLDAIKHKKVEEKYFANLNQGKEPLVEETWETFIESELYSILIKAVEKLPPECQKIITYSRFRYYSNKEIAEKLNISVKTVENQISKALKILRLELKDYLPLILWLVMHGYK
jgi:RNA polymerase sigma-70 factor (ECF subfamily)